MEFSFKKILALLVLSGLIVATLCGVAQASPPWSDAPNSWWVSSYGVTEAEVATVADGYPGGLFRPGLAVTRGQFAKMSVSGLAIDTASPASPTFKDVIKSNPLYPYIEGAYAAGLIGGYPGSAGLTFKPSSNINRQQADSILGRYLSDLEIDTTGAIHGTTNTYGTLDLWYNAEGKFHLEAFDDWKSVGSTHRAAIAYLIFRDIVKGSHSKLTPTATLNRAQAAALILRVKAEAGAIMTPPGAPSNLAVVATGAAKVVTFNAATQQYLGNDSTPQVTGDTLANRPVAIYDGGVKLVEDASNSAGKFYTDVPTTLSDGSHVFTAKVKNANGLVSPASAGVTYILDTVAPTGSIKKPAVPSGRTYAPVGNAKPEFTASAADDRSGVKQVEFQVAVKQANLSWQTVSVDTAPDSGTNNYAAVWPTTGTLSAGLTDGQYQFRVIITDNAGNQTTLTAVDVTVDLSKPAATITAPVAAGVFYTESPIPTFTATAVDATGTSSSASNIASVSFYYAVWAGANTPKDWDGFTLISTDIVMDWAADYSALPGGHLPDGHYLFAAKATDLVGNDSALTTNGSYAPGATQEVVIDHTAPYVLVTGPYTGQSVQESAPNDPKTVNITWTLDDVSPPDTVDIDYTLDGSVASPVWLEVKAGAPNTGSYTWTVPDIVGDKTHVMIRIKAVDKAGPQVGNVAGHTTVAFSGQFTIFDLPVAVSNLVGMDNDTTTGLDVRDFTATWTVSPSPDIASQSIYILPADVTTLDVGHDVPIKIFYDNTTNTWTGTDTSTTDSKGAHFVAGDSYKIWVVVTDVGGRVALASSPAFTVTED